MVYSECERDAQHALVANHPHLQSGVAIDGSDQRDKAVGGEVNMVNPLAGLAKDIGKDQIDQLAVREQALTLLTWQSAKKTIRRGNTLRSWQGTLLERWENQLGCRLFGRHAELSISSNRADDTVQRAFSLPSVPKLDARHHRFRILTSVRASHASMTHPFA